MPCLVCGKRIPLLLQLSRSQFCSETHEQQHTALQEKQIIARLSPPPRFSLRGPAILAVSSREWISSRPVVDVSIRTFQDLILCRPSQAIQGTLRVKGAKTISALPRESPPGAARI